MSAQLRGLIAAIGCIGITGFGFSISFPLLSVLLEQGGASSLAPIF
jgi:hypothetical protein